MFWVDEIVEDILKKIDKESYLATDWTTPSGHAHFGSLRGVVIHDLIREGLSNKDKKSKFIFGFDDFDPMDGLPVYVDTSFEKYMGMPLRDIPAPDGKSESFAAQYMNELQQIILNLGADVQFVKIYDYYKDGSYNESIKIVLDNVKEIRKIYKEISGSEKGEDWYPLNVVCPQCGKIGTTKVTDWDGKEVEFECVENLVEWAKGCGYKGRTSPLDGSAKLPWKVDWPCRWNIFGTDIEGEGKDHFVAGGSRHIADAIYKQIIKKDPPYDIRYEHLLIGGAKMSSSKGLGVTAQNMSELLPSNMLRFLFVRTKYKKALEFNPAGDTIPLMYDEYDRCNAAYHEDPNSDQGRAYYYAEIDLKKEQPKYMLRFSKIAYMLQMPRVDILEYAKTEKASLQTPDRSDGGQGSDLTVSEKLEIENRIETAKKWLEKFAPESFKFNISDTLPEKAKDLSDTQKEFLKKLSQEISNNNYSGEELHKKIHEIKTEMGIAPTDAFSAIYWIFIGKDSGPQAGWLLASLDKNMVINRLEEAIK